MSKKLSTQEKARRAWVRALRSKRYGWGKEELHPDDGKYCCLGVLCEVAMKMNVIGHYDPHSGQLPKEVQMWAGLDDNMGGINSGDSLAEINDKAKRNPFKKIATLIERKPSGLFVEEQE